MDPIQTNPSDVPASQPAKFPVWLCLAGIVFMICWIGAFMVLGTAMMMATVMANASGAATTSAHMLFIGGVFFGNLLAGAAGIPGGLAFFLRGRRWMMFWIFAGLLLAGVASVAVGFGIFFLSAS
ncbi:MAG: hypothetical protein ACOVMP_02055 [Chthoniobacterales bacterium]